jgi:hypothetical protein
MRESVFALYANNNMQIIMHMTIIMAIANKNSSSRRRSLRGSCGLSGLSRSIDSTTAPANASASTKTLSDFGVESSGQVHAFFTAVRRILF